MEEGVFFVHIALSRGSRKPSWEAVKVVKNAFLDEVSEVFHVLPEKTFYINLHPYCLHIWQPADEQRWRREEVMR